MRIASEISAPALRKLDIDLHIMDGRSFNMLRHILEETPKCPELSQCTTEHRRDHMSDRVDDALSSLAMKVKKRGEIEWIMRTTSS